MSTRGPWVVAAALVIAPAAGLAALAALTTDDPTELARRPAVVTATPLAAAENQGEPADLTASFGDPLTARAGGPAGTVTAVRVMVGRVVAQGAPLFDVDGRTVVAMVGGQPPYRDLRLGDRGRDVRGLRTFLGEVGLLRSPGSGELFDDATRRAVAALQLRGGASGTGVFDRSMVVWVPTKDFRVSTVDVEVGAPAPPVGQPVLSSTGVVRSATLSGPDGTPVQVSGPTEVTLAGAALGTTDGTGPSLVALVSKALSSGAATVPRPSDDAGHTGAPATLKLSVTVAARSTVPAVRIASSAVMTDPTGARTCVWVQGAGGPEARPVTVVSGGLGVTSVTGLPSTATVIVNPVDALGSVSCPAS